MLRQSTAAPLQLQVEIRRCSRIRIVQPSIMPAPVYRDTISYFERGLKSHTCVHAWSWSIPRAATAGAGFGDWKPRRRHDCVLALPTAQATPQFWSRHWTLHAASTGRARPVPDPMCTICEMVFLGFVEHSNEVSIGAERRMFPHFKSFAVGQVLSTPVFWQPC
jgi:hypothetical protein